MSKPRRRRRRSSRPKQPEPTQGRVKWFNDKKGYGFVRVSGVEEDIFVHWRSILMAGFKTLETDQEVEVVWVRRSRGLHAIECRPK